MQIIAAGGLMNAVMVGCVGGVLRDLSYPAISTCRYNNYTTKIISCCIM